MANIIEKANRTAIPRIEVRERLHGHTVIDLFNTRTKKYERVEHDNHFTDGISSYCKCLSHFNNSPFSISNWNNTKVTRTLLGGVLLFDTALPTSPDAKYMPAGTTMTANGCYGVVSTEAPTEMGSYNSVESSEGDNSVTMVYDWGQSFGNGNIASVALTTAEGGYIGYGNQSGSAKTTMLLTEGQTVSSIASENNDSTGFVLAGSAKLAYNERFYIPYPAGLNAGTDSVIIKHRSMGIETLDVFEQWNLVVPNDFPGTLTIPISATSQNMRVVSAGAKFPSCFLLIPTGSVDNGDSFEIYLVDVSDSSYEKYTVTNNTGATIYSIDNGLLFWLIDDTYALVRTGSASGDFYKINYKTSELIGKATPTPSVSSEARNFCGGSITEDLLGGMAGGYIYDSELNRFSLTNGSLSKLDLRSSYYENSTAFDYDVNSDILRFSYYSTYYHGGSFGVFKNPLRLMTINNLDSPVVKTAEKTMKVTYTITRA